MWPGARRGGKNTSQKPAAATPRSGGGLPSANACFRRQMRLSGAAAGRDGRHEPASTTRDLPSTACFPTLLDS